MFERYYFLRAKALLLPLVFGHVFLGVDEKRKVLMFGPWFLRRDAWGGENFFGGGQSDLNTP
jgi:hypothetical protein